MGAIWWGRRLVKLMAVARSAANRRRRIRPWRRRRVPDGRERGRRRSHAEHQGGPSAFLANKRVAVTGVSTPKTHGSNNVYKRLRERGYEVFAVNPNADEVEGDSCYQDLKSIPGGVQAVVIGRGPRSPRTRCMSAPSSASPRSGCIAVPAKGASRTPTAYGRQHGITVIDGGCPCMFGPTADFGHKVMRLVYAGHVPKQV